MRLLPRALLAGGLGLAALALTACGGNSGLLSSDQATTLSAQLTQVSEAVGSGQCAAATNAANGFGNSVQNLNGVNPALESNLRQGAGLLNQLAAQDCQSQTTTSTTTSSTSTPTSTTTSTTTSLPTSTATTTSAPTSSPATSPAAPGNSGGASGNSGAQHGNGNGNGNGNGGSGGRGNGGGGPGHVSGGGGIGNGGGNGQ